MSRGVRLCRSQLRVDGAEAAKGKNAPTAQLRVQRGSRARILSQSDNPSGGRVNRCRRRRKPLFLRDECKESGQQIWPMINLLLSSHIAIPGNSSNSGPLTYRTKHVATQSPPKASEGVLAVLGGQQSSAPPARGGTLRSRRGLNEAAYNGMNFRTASSRHDPVIPLYTNCLLCFVISRTRKISFRKNGPKFLAKFDFWVPCFDPYRRKRDQETSAFSRAHSAGFGGRSEGVWPISAEDCGGHVGGHTIHAHWTFRYQVPGGIDLACSWAGV